jgi:toxin YoeB
MDKTWTDRAWEDYLYWQVQDKKILKRLNQLIQDIDRNPYDGIGHPEQLRGDMSGWWSLSSVNFRATWKSTTTSTP